MCVARGPPPCFCDQECDAALPRYCVQFQLGSIPGSCGQARAPHAQWTRYLTQGHTVCVRCEWPAQDTRSRRCYGDGGGAKGNKMLLGQAAGHPGAEGPGRS
ncbi:somatomedin-B and thrombospondin type-1 domain-containing protein-like [Symphalangus syndactylus]|uniref:somatomedin-B and thrombospondin type-1 domain-containing protein-like n=1 Tax=Symphalangus syndactylus TaxID=9590 RepID=UPI0030057320